MSVRVTVQPEFVSGNENPITQVQIDVNCTEITQLLSEYDVLLLTTLVVKRTEEGKLRRETYEYSEIYRNIMNSKITFQTVVYGIIEDEGWIECKTQGILVKKR